MSHTNVQHENASRDRLTHRSPPAVEAPLYHECETNNSYVSTLEELSRKGPGELTGLEYLWLTELIQFVISGPVLSTAISNSKGLESISAPFATQLLNHLRDGAPMHLSARTVYSLICLENPHCYYNSELRIKVRNVDMVMVQRFWNLGYEEMIASLHMLLKYLNIGE